MTCYGRHLQDGGDDGNDGQPPPTYESILSLSSHQPSTTKDTTDNNKENSNTAPVPQPVLKPVPSLAGLPDSSAFNTVYSLLGREHGIVSIGFVIDPRVPRAWKAAPWEATLTVKCPDVPRLMREGFFWSADNIVPEEGFMKAVGPRSRAYGYSHVRTWILTDKPESRGRHGNSQWVACLEVSATAIETLTGFMPQNMTRAHIWKANAWDEHGRTIYNYDSYTPAQNYNCVYDDTPLRGWWPWPRREDGE